MRFLSYAYRISSNFVFLALVFYPLHLFWSLRALRHQLDPQIVDRFQNQYRTIYAVIGIAMLASLFYR